MPSLFDDARNSLLNDELDRKDDMKEALDRAIDNDDERMQREKDQPDIDREVELDKGLQDIRDQAMRDIDDRDKNGGQGRADAQGAIISAMAHR